MNTVTDFAVYMSRYLTNHLPVQCNYSPNTILAYRDMFKLLLRFAESEMSLKPEKITLSKINGDFVAGFLDWLEHNKGSSIATRNQRLSAIHAFFKYLQKEKPELMEQCQQINAIPVKRAAKATVDYLDADVVRAILQKPDTREKYGLRDSVVLGLLYESGARVSEITELKPMDLRLKNPATVTVKGKGGKLRACPISQILAANLSVYLNRWNLDGSESTKKPLFVNHMGEKICRAGVTYILQKYAAQVCDTKDVAFCAKVTPHIFRHSKAMHLLQAGVNLIYIRDYLGHASVQTTEIYARTNPEMKRAALQKAGTTETAQSFTKPWLRDGEMMNFLNSLGN